MIMSYKECIAKYGSPHQINKAIAAGQLFKIEPGIYAETASVPVETILAKKYPQAVFSGRYAFHAHNLTDQMPQRYTLTTGRKTSPIADGRVEQLYVREGLLYLGAVERTIEWDKGRALLYMYDKERMLIELLRYKHRIPRETYKEILNNYKEILLDLDLVRVQEYATKFPKGQVILRRFEEEVV